MAEELIKSVQAMLTEEKWTRAAISNYSKSNFDKLEEIVNDAKTKNCIDEIKTLCDEHLEHTKNSIVALYVSGMLALAKRDIDHSALDDLIEIFQDNHKSNVVVYLAEKILDADSVNKFALRILSDYYRSENNDSVWAIDEQLVKLDHEDAERAKRLAEYNEKNGNAEVAIDYYKKAVLRYVMQKELTQTKEVWSKLVALIPEEIDFFYSVQRKIAKSINAEKSATMMQELYAYYLEQKRWDTAIDILKLVLGIDDKDAWARKELVECFRGKYAEHTQLEECIRVSNLAQNWRNVFEAITDFEKHIAFDAKNFVFHRSWGVGIIQKVTTDALFINFGKKSGSREISLKMAVNALYPLSRDHIWVLKATKPREELAEKIKSDKAWALKIIIKSFDNNCDFKHIKTELVPSVLTPSEWTSWSSSSRKILESDSAFGVNPDNVAFYTVREREVSQAEKLANEFKAQKKFFERIDILMRFVAESGTDSELFAEMFDYFASYVKSFNSVSEQVMASYLVVRRVISENPTLDFPLQADFAQLFADIDNARDMYLSLKDSKNTFLRQDFLRCIKDFLPNWVEVYITLFPVVRSSAILKSLIEAGRVKDVQALVSDCFTNFRDYREAAIFFYNECGGEDWFIETGISEEKQLITLIRIMDLTFREMENHIDTAENRKINNQVQKILFKADPKQTGTGALLRYILEHDEDTVTRLYTLIDDIHDIDPTIKMNMRNRILENFPSFKFYGSEEKTVAPQGLWVTQKMLESKKQQLEHITKVEIPLNSKEIGEALAQGDLRENAEYKAAKEKQGILSSTASKLEEEIARAQIFDPTTVTTSRASFGTVVTLKNNASGKDEVYTILGPWESDPNNGIISYMSPFGNSILNAKEKDSLKFGIGERKLDYEVLKIVAASFD
ncbi:MAG: transcription elongation factor GreA [Treponemataceae bacterium]|nr:MAG: transcription elongation factor GreA [Treponemataceae bacterium]